MTPHTPLIEALKERWQDIDRELAPGEPTSAALMRDALIEILRLNEALRIATETQKQDGDKDLVDRNAVIERMKRAMNNSELQLHAGELSAQERLAVKAVMNWLLSDIQSLPQLAGQPVNVESQSDRADVQRASSVAAQSIRAEAFKRAGDFIEDIVGAFKNEDARRKVATAIRSLGDRG